MLAQSTFCCASVKVYLISEAEFACQLSEETTLGQLCAHNECHLIIVYPTPTNTSRALSVTHKATASTGAPSYFLQQNSQTAFIFTPELCLGNQLLVNPTKPKPAAAAEITRTNLASFTRSNSPEESTSERHFGTRCDPPPAL